MAFTLRTRLLWFWFPGLYDFTGNIAVYSISISVYSLIDGYLYDLYEAHGQCILWSHNVWSRVELILRRSKYG